MKKLYLLLSILFLIYWGCEEAAEPEDCAGVAGGSAVEDNCGVCDDNPANDCIEDCSGVWGGNNICGCTDSTATNYDSTATFDDESCEYDTTTPTVNITFPINGTTVYEIVSITCISTDNEGVEKVELWVNGVSTGVTDDSEPFSLEWNTTTIQDGSYTITIRSYDTSDNVTDSGPIVLTVDNTLSIPTTVELYPITYNDGFQISWSQNNDDDFQSYKLFGSLSENMSNQTLVYETDDRTDTTFIITILNSKYYQIVVEDLWGFQSTSNIEVGDYDFELWGEYY
ncbi:uncharacterized protein METZ01_LOCUS379603, partial [marine metagenome]